jgi:hypothetical protein
MTTIMRRVTFLKVFDDLLMTGEAAIGPAYARFWMLVIGWRRRRRLIRQQYPTVVMSAALTKRDGFRVLQARSISYLLRTYLRRAGQTIAPRTPPTPLRRPPVSVTTIKPSALGYDLTARERAVPAPW